MATSLVLQPSVFGFRPVGSRLAEALLGHGDDATSTNDDGILQRLPPARPAKAPVTAGADVALGLFMNDPTGFWTGWQTVHVDLSSFDVLALQTLNTLKALDCQWWADMAREIRTTPEADWTHFLPETLELLEATDAEQTARRFITHAQHMMLKYPVQPWIARMLMTACVEFWRTPPSDVEWATPTISEVPGIIEVGLCCSKPAPAPEPDAGATPVTQTALAFKTADGVFGVTGDDGRTKLLTGVTAYRYTARNELVGYKVASLADGRSVVVVLLIRPTARTTFVPDATNLKFRTDAAHVLAILPVDKRGRVGRARLDRAFSIHDSGYQYRAGIEQRPTNAYNPNPRTQCGGGLHFVATLDGLARYAKQFYGLEFTDTTAVTEQVQLHLNARHAVGKTTEI